MGAREGRLLPFRRERHAVDEMVAVALDMRQAQQRDQRQVLLHAHPRERRQVLGRHEILLRAGLGVELGDPCRVQDRLIGALAVLAGDAAVAELHGRRKRADLAVGLVDQHRLQPRQRIDRLLQRRGPLDRLLDEQRGCHQPLQRRRLPHAAPQFGDALDRVVLLVAVERRPILAGAAVEHAGDAREPVEISGNVAAHLELVVAAAVVAHDLLERLRQAIVDALAPLLVGGDDRIDQPDRVPHRNLRARAQIAEEPLHIEARKIGREAARGDARHVAADHLRKRQAQRAAQRIEDGAIQQRRAVGCHKRHQPQLGAPRHLVPVGIGIEAEGRAPAPRAVEIGGKPDRLPQLLDVLRVAEGRALVEPLGGHAGGGAAVLERDGGANDGLGALGDRDDPEPERQAQRVVALEALDLLQLDLGICGHVCGHRLLR